MPLVSAFKCLKTKRIYDATSPKARPDEMTPIMAYRGKNIGRMFETKTSYLAHLKRLVYRNRFDKNNKFVIDVVEEINNKFRKISSLAELENFVLTHNKFFVLNGYYHAKDSWSTLADDNSVYCDPEFIRNTKFLWVKANIQSIDGNIAWIELTIELKSTLLLTYNDNIFYRFFKGTDISIYNGKFGGKYTNTRGIKIYAIQYHIEIQKDKCPKFFNSISKSYLLKTIKDGFTNYD